MGDEGKVEDVAEVNRADRLRAATIGLLSGALAGLVAGVGARLAMRLVAVAGGVPPGFGIPGTLTILFVALLYGIAGGLLFVAVRERLPGTGLAQGLALCRRHLTRHHLGKLRLEHVAFAGEGPDQDMAAVAERAADVGDALDERVLVGGPVVPDRVDQLVLGDDPAGVPGQVVEHIEGLRPELGLYPVPQQGAARPVEDERAEP